MSAVSLALGILPVLLFLLALILLDSYKLVPLRWVVLLVVVGSGVGLACMFLNPRVKDLMDVTVDQYARYEAPILEELLKGLVIYVAIALRRIGFLVDAAIWGFAVGAGFAAVENLHYFLVLDQPSLLVWTIRGFGTAIMHGGATAILAVTAKHFTDRFDSVRIDRFLPGLVLAAGIHSLFNHFYFSPVLSTLGLIVVLPLLFAAVFRVSEDATQQWLGVGFDSDQELLEIINRGQVSDTRIGRYLISLRERLPPSTVVDMLNLIRLRLELSIRAKGVLLMRKAGFEAPPDPEVEERFRELAHLEKSIGRTGRIALQPIFSLSSRDLWQHRVLGRR